MNITNSGEANVEKPKDSAEVIELFPKPKPKPEAWCSFCKRKESQVKKLISNSGEGNYLRNICGDCVKLAFEKIKE